MIRYCTEASAEVSEPLAGWGVHNPSTVLIQWPKALWQHSPRLAKGMDDALRTAIDRLASRGVRVNLIDRKSADNSRCRVYIFPAARMFDAPPEALPALIDAIEDGRTIPDASSELAAPLVLCCTHGKHDLCCAKFGFNTYRALVQKADEAYPGQFDIWEATHLGGCRFATTVLVLPQLHKYGRVNPGNAAEVLRAEAAGRIYLPLYRGRSDWHAAAQTAEICVRSASPHMPIDSKLSAVLLKDEARYKVYQIDFAEHRFEVHCQAREIQSFSSCDDISSGKPAKSRVAWSASILSG